MYGKLWLLFIKDVVRNRKAKRLLIVVRHIADPKNRFRQSTAAQLYHVINTIKEYKKFYTEVKL